MTILIVSKTLLIDHDCHVILPALRELKLGTLAMRTGAKIEASALDILDFANGVDVRIDSQRFSVTNRSLLEGGYLLSPNTSIIADSHLLSITVVNLLAKSPKVTHATLRFDNWARARRVLGRLVGFKMETDSGSAENGTFCSRLSELRLDFGWELTEPSASREWLIDALKARREDGITPPLSIYVGWRGEEEYVLLTSD